MAETKTTTTKTAAKSTSSKTTAAKTTATKPVATKTTTKTAATKAAETKTAAKAPAAKATATKPATKAPAKAATTAKAAAPAKVEAKPVQTKKAHTVQKTKKTDGPMVKVTLVKSGMGRLKKQMRTLEALGLGKVNSSNVLPDNAATRGMIFVVKHLVKVEKV